MERAEGVQMVSGISRRSKESGLAPRPPHLRVGKARYVKLFLERPLWLL